MRKQPVFQIILLWNALVWIYSEPAFAQSWSAFKQLAEEQAQKGQLSQAEDSWRASLRLMKESGSTDSRLYISALQLAKVQIQEKKDADARQLLRNVCTEHLANTQQVSEEQISCVKTYLELCDKSDDKIETARAKNLLEQLLQKQAVLKPADNSVSLVFGEEALAQVRKKLAHARELITQKDYVGAEKELNEASSYASSNHVKSMMNSILSEQARLYGLTKDNKKAELAYRNLLTIVKEESGTDSHNYLQVLGPHARLLQLLGESEKAAIELTACSVISSKLKTVPIAIADGAEGGISWHLNSVSHLPSSYAPAYGAAVTPLPRPVEHRGPQISGQLRVLEFYAVW
ncbi:MAG: hypothetical protein K2X81_01045 [Candidatus Obscuribacterales bacterium]|nr:hypothetical protein [Candidatus Obscuribacterales bacterium]